MRDLGNRGRFDIDFFEFSFLVEACIPPRPIARSMFWYDVIDKYYHVLSDDERTRLFEWIQKNDQFNQSNEDCLLFYNRYDPDNQYEVVTKFNGKEETHKCFKHDSVFRTGVAASVVEEFIIAIKKIENE